MVKFPLILRIEQAELDQIWQRRTVIIGASQICLEFQTHWCNSERWCHEGDKGRNSIKVAVFLTPVKLRGAVVQMSEQIYRDRPQNIRSLTIIGWVNNSDIVKTWITMTKTPSPGFSTKTKTKFKTKTLGY